MEYPELKHTLKQSRMIAVTAAALAMTFGAAHAATPGAATRRAGHGDPVVPGSWRWAATAAIAWKCACSSSSNNCTAN